MSVALMSRPVEKAPSTVKKAAKKIMVVEDESVISLDIKNSLLNLGYVVTGVAASGDAALRKIENNIPDLVLMDIHLKGDQSGIEVSQKIKSDYRIPVVYLTANADISTFQAAKDTDPYGYLLKPFEQKTLGMTIEIALHKHEQQQVVQSSESWYASTFQSLTEAVIATDRHGYIVFMNACAESMLDIRLKEALNQPLKNVLMFQKKIQQFDGLNFRESVGSILYALVNGTTTVDFPEDIRLVRQAHIPIQGRATALRDTAGRVTGTIFMFSEKRANSEQLRSLESILDSPSLSKQSLSNPAFSKSLILASDAPIRDASEDTFPEWQTPDLDPVSDDDAKLIQDFVHGFIHDHPVVASTDHLIAKYSSDGTKLVDRQGNPIVVVKTLQGKLTAIVKLDSPYWDALRHTLVDNRFFPVSRRTNGTCYFRCCAIPERCSVYYTPADQLWQAWQGGANPMLAKHSHLRNRVQRGQIRVLRRGQWHCIQQMVFKSEAIRLKTIAGEMYLPLDDSVVWGIEG